MDPQRPDLPGEVTAVLDWWREAGVDYAFDNAPRPWITAPEVRNDTAAPGDPAAGEAPRAAAPSPRAMIGGDRAGWPAELSAWTPWWMREPSLDHGQLRGRVPPRGPGVAPLMVLVPEPEAEDSDTLLSGSQGRLLAAMLAAMGLREDQVYIASALPRHTPMADWPDLAAQGLSEVLRQHIALVAPQRLMAFGRHFPQLLALPGLESPLPGHAPTQTGEILRYFSHDGQSVPLLIARDLGALLERPIAKGRFWQQWLEWSAG